MAFVGILLAATACAGTTGAGSDAGAVDGNGDGDAELPDCSGHGTWSADHGHCECDDGYSVAEDTSCIGNDDGGDDAEPWVSALPLSCSVVAVDCDPRNGDGCDEGHTCDLGEVDGSTAMVCYPPPNDVPVGGACSNQTGPFCEPGAWCTGPDGTCEKVCCDHAECGEGEICVGIYTEPATFGALGTCRDGDAPQCLPAGATCSPLGDQCCGACHNDHCH